MPSVQEQWLNWRIRARVDVQIVTGPEKSDPASVVFDGMGVRWLKNIDVLMIDTAGRLKTRTTSWPSLKNRTNYQAGEPDAPHETLL